MRKMLGALAGAALLAVSWANHAVKAGEIVVYTAEEAEDLKTYAAAFNKAYPDIKIKWVRDSTGIVTAKLLAEKNNPVADAIWGLSGSSLLVLKSEGLLDPYKPAGLEKLDKKFIDKSSPPSWVGIDAYVGAVCFNTIEAAKDKLPKPKSWMDFTKPVYKGKLVMPNPNSSGTGFLFVSSWLQMFGEKKGWAFMDKLHENMARYTHSGSKPCKLAAAGETDIGLSFAFRAARLKDKGAPIDVVIPEEGIGWEIEAAAMIAGTPHAADVKKLMDWAVTPEAMRVYNRGYAVLAIPGIAKPVSHFPEKLLEKMLDQDFEWAANNRARILKEWARRYDSKSDPKKK